MSDTPIQSLVNQVTQDVNRIKHRSPEDVQSYANQLQLCTDMLQKLTDLQGELLRITQSYHLALIRLEANQYLDEELKSFSPVLSDFAQRAEGLVMHLGDHHMRYIEARSVHLSAELNQVLND